MLIYGFISLIIHEKGYNTQAKFVKRRAGARLRPAQGGKKASFFGFQRGRFPAALGVAHHARLQSATMPSATAAITGSNLAPKFSALKRLVSSARSCFIRLGG